MFKKLPVGLAILTYSVGAVSLRHHHHHKSIPACNSSTFPGCLKAETAAAQKLQADMDVHAKDYFIPNFGVDHDIITTQRNFKNAGGKLVQKQSIPACNSSTFPGCLKAETAAAQKLQADMDVHAKDYFIPNFGVDHDIITTQNNFKKAGGKLVQKQSIPACNSSTFPGCLKAETAAAQKLQADMDVHAKDYFIPNFGVDHDIITTQNNFKKAGGKLVQKQSIPACNSSTFPGCLKAETAAAQKLQADMDVHAKDYFIPNFGVDHDIITTQNNFKKAGGKLAQQESIPACNSSTFPGCLKAETAAAQKLQADMDVHAKDYFIPNFGVDHDIITTQRNFKNAGGKLAQLEKQSIPACNSSTFPGCLKAETAAAQKLQADMDVHAKDYFIPNFGVDHDIITTQNNFKKAGGKLVQKQSIPACNSSTFPGCLKAETAAAQKLQADMDVHAKDYFIPNFGVDHDIITTQNNFKKAGGKLAQLEKQSIPACNSSTFPGCLKAETAAAQKLQADMDVHAKDYFIPNFGVDHDIITTQNNFKKAGGKLAQLEKSSIPACDSDGGCKTETASPWKQKGDPVYDAPNFPLPAPPLPPLPKHALLQLEEQSDPICTSAGCGQYLHPSRTDDWPRGYSVPDFGVDKDIKITQANNALVGDFDPSKIAPDAYEGAEFNLQPIWERSAPLAGYQQAGMDRWLSK